MSNDRYGKLSQEASNSPLSGLLPDLLIIAQDAGKEDIAKWATLELGGYFRGNSALTEDVVVPEYRTVAVSIRIDMVDRW